MRDLVTRAIAAGVGAIALGTLAVPASAADIPAPQGYRQAPPPAYYGEQEYYAPPPVQRYVYRPAPAYVYPANPYYYPGPVVVPGPYYRPYAWGYGRFGRPWGYRRW